MTVTLAQQRSLPFLNVVDFGASPNNAASVNDSAFAAAIAALPATGGAIVVPTVGTYQISVPIVIDKEYVSLIGFGTRAGSPTIQVTSADPSYAIIVGNTKNVAYCLIEGLNIQGLNATTSTGAGINFRSPGGHIRNTQVKLFGGTGINLASFSGSVFEVFLDNVTLLQNGMNTGSPGDNLVITSDLSDCEYHRIISSGDAAKSTTRHGINNSGANQKFVNCHAYFCSQDGFRNTGSNTQIIGGEWETNGSRGIGSFNINMRVVDAYLYNNGNIGIQAASSGFSIVGCLLQNNTNQDILTSAAGGAIVACDCSGSFVAILLDTGATAIRVAENALAASTANVLTIKSTHSIIHDNSIASGGNIVEQTGANNNLIHDNDLVSGTITLIGSATKLRNNQGYNPVGQVTAPTFPATTVAATNTTGVDVTAFVANGTGAITQVQIAGQNGTYNNTNLQIAASGWGSIRIPVGGSVKFTYASGTPTWTWMGE